MIPLRARLTRCLVGRTGSLDEKLRDVRMAGRVPRYSLRALILLDAVVARFSYNERHNADPSTTRQGRGG